MVNTMAKGYNETEYLLKYVKAFEKNTRNRMDEQGIISKEASPIILESLYKMYQSLNLEMDEQSAKTIFDHVHPGFMKYANNLEKGKDNKRTSFIKSIFVGQRNTNNRVQNNYNSYRRIDIER